MREALISFVIIDIHDYMTSKSIIQEKEEQKTEQQENRMCQTKSSLSLTP